MKLLVQRPASVVADAIAGLCMLHAHLAPLRDHHVVVDVRRAGDSADAQRARDTRVALISGGGSGHEPAHAGYVGEGMLSAAVLGDVFTSPSPHAVLAAVRAVSGAAGCVLIIKNYTGDCMNFSLAREMAQSQFGLRVEMVVVGDDCASLLDGERGTGRGIAGTVLVHKIAGALAAQGAPLDAVVAAARSVAAGLRSIGVGLSGCTVPAAGKRGFELGDGEMELGLGIHGEKGIERCAFPSELPAQEVCGLMASVLQKHALEAERDAEHVLLVNNLGSTTALEMSIVASCALRAVRSTGVTRVARVLCAPFMTALEMAGVSLTLLAPCTADMLAWLDAPTDAPGWPRTSAGTMPMDARAPIVLEERSTAPVTAVPRGAPASADDAAAARAVAAGILSVWSELAANADALNELDRQCGDGDMGVSMARGHAAIERAREQLLTSASAAGALRVAADVLMEALGGSSGPLIAVFLMRASSSLAAGAPWQRALESGLGAVMDAGGARPGDRTLVDALAPSVAAFAREADAGQPLAAAIGAAERAARAGADSTRSMLPRRGRARYLGERVAGAVDPGAHAVALAWGRAAAITTTATITSGATEQ